MTHLLLMWIMSIYFIQITARLCKELKMEKNRLWASRSLLFLLSFFFTVFMVWDRIDEIGQKLHFKNSYFCWGIVALQYCISFCCATKWAKCTHILPPTWASSHAHRPHSPPAPLAQHRAELSPVLRSSSPLAGCGTWAVCVSVLLSQKRPLWLYGQLELVRRACQTLAIERRR